MSYDEYLEDLKVFGNKSQKLIPLSQNVGGWEGVVKGVGVELLESSTRHPLNSPNLEDSDYDREVTLQNLVFGSSYPRLTKARDFFNSLKQGDLELLMNVFELWKNYDTYLFLKGTHRETAKTQFLLSKCSKRGNDVYARRIDTRLGFLKYGEEEKFFDGQDFDGK